MSLLTISQDAARECKMPVPSAIVSSTDQIAVDLLGYAKREVTVLKWFAPWQALVKETTFTTVASATQTGVIPSDFDYILPDTVWDRTNYTRLVGPKMPSEWQALQALVTSTGIPSASFRIRGDAFLMHPVPAAGATVAFEYVIDTPVTDSGGTTYRTNWVADADLSLIDDALVTMGVVWRFKRGLGQPYDDELNAYLDEVQRAAKRDNDAPNMKVAEFRDMVFRPGGVDRFDWRIGW